MGEEINVVSVDCACGAYILTIRFRDSHNIDKIAVRKDKMLSMLAMAERDEYFSAQYRQ